MTTTSRSDKILFPYFGVSDFNKDIPHKSTFNINKLNNKEFELEFFIDRDNVTDISFSINPIACDHTIVLLFEIKDSKSLYSYSTTSHIATNKGFWIVEVLESRGITIDSIISDRNKDNKSLHSTLFKESFSLSIDQGVKDSDPFNGYIKLFLEKL